MEYRYLEKRIERKCSEIRRWRERAVVMTPSYNTLPKGGKEDRIQVATEMIWDLCDELDGEVSQLLLRGKEIQEAIERVKEPTLRLLLKYRYLDDVAWPQIAKLLNYNERWIFRLHERALEAIEINRPLKVST